MYSWLEVYIIYYQLFNLRNFKVWNSSFGYVAIFPKLIFNFTPLVDTKVIRINLLLNLESKMHINSCKYTQRTSIIFHNIFVVVSSRFRQKLFHKSLNIKLLYFLATIFWLDPQQQHLPSYKAYPMFFL
jgi:hypothetical protein